MGSGLACNQTGRHISYTAGTGILVFLDIVAYLLIRVTDKFYGTGIGPNIVKKENAPPKELSSSQTSAGISRNGPGI
jgi:hypothetical protein